MNGLVPIIRLTLLENARRQIFHVLVILLLTMVAGAALLAMSMEGTRAKMITDLCLSGVLFGGALLAVALGATGIQADMEQRTIYAALARPVTRSTYLLGRYIGTLLTVYFGLGAMCVAFVVLLAGLGEPPGVAFLLSILFAMLQTALLCAVATALSTTCSPAITAMLTLLVVALGNMKTGTLLHLFEEAAGISRYPLMAIYHVLPTLEAFNLEGLLVHGYAPPTDYLIQVAVYAVLYCAVLLSAGIWILERRDL